MRIGFVGAGNMAAAMARGWAGADGFDAELSFTDAGSGRAAKIAAELGGEARDSIAALAADADLVVLALKPAGLTKAAADLSKAGKPVLSVLGATSVETLEAAMPGVAVIRVMPNVGVEVRQGVLCYAFGAEIDDQLQAQVTELLGQLGTAMPIKDELIDAATAVMGCSPAYVALVCEALTDAAVREGIATEQAREMVIEAFAGTAELLRRHEHDTLSVRRLVTSPGGSTAAGLAALERGSVRAAFADAVTASLQKMRQ